MADGQKSGSYEGFTPEERAAMKERSKELKAQAKRQDSLKDVMDKIAEMPPADRAIAERVHAIITETAPGLTPKTWYGQPAYARDGEVVIFFQAADKFKTRYSTLGFSDAAHLDDGEMWATSFALNGLTDADEAKITKLVKKAAG